ncbi:MAG: hypothetical protein QOF16_1352 [Actinomycetota bacterium]|jgi:hypothetical protein|nr:hypothetical protein [Actinomycetota bacterium]MEA2487698.1 hypothetical protein [Actinomycetota bacterium]
MKTTTDHYDVVMQNREGNEFRLRQRGIAEH